MTLDSKNHQRNAAPIKRTLAAWIFMAALASPAYAIDVDREQPIQIESDSAVIDDSQGLSEYSGNVIISQGSTLLEADHIQVTALDRSISKIVATGAPAHFRQQDSQNDATTGTADQITYLATEAVLIFNGNAKLAQTNNSFSGDRIEYDIMQKAIRAKGDESTGSRVKIQYFPNSGTPDSNSEPPNTSE
jgi:lipopolysaccharide export system protein LptA